MKVVDLIKQTKGETFVSFEVLPPLKGGGMQAIFDLLDPLMEFKPPFIDVTYHRQEFIYKIQESGFYEKSAIRKRPGTVGICASIMHHYDVEAVPHLICGGFTQEDTENALIDLNFLGIKNVLALRGDARKFDKRFLPEPGGHAYAVDLVRQIKDMNSGVYLDENIANGAQTDFCIGVAGYPEKHFEAPNMEVDLKYTKDKINAGAEYIVTQMIFDNAQYFKYVEMCRNEGIHVPIIPGLKPITRKSQLQSIPRTFYVNLPTELVKAAEKEDSKDAISQIGIEWCIQQSLELKEGGVPCIHYYTMGDAETTRKIVEKVI